MSSESDIYVGESLKICIYCRAEKLWLFTRFEGSFNETQWSGGDDVVNAKSSIINVCSIVIVLGTSIRVVASSNPSLVLAIMSSCIGSVPLSRQCKQNEFSTRKIKVIGLGTSIRVVASSNPSQANGVGCCEELT